LRADLAQRAIVCLFHLQIVRIVFALWTIAVPGSFFIESVYGVDDTKRSNSDIDFKSRQDELKALQDAARSVWTGCAAAVAVLLWKFDD
jgi:hypothetical protein